MQDSFDVFLSYNSQDVAVAEELARGLEARGLRVFWDKRNLPLGQGFPEQLEIAIERSCAAAVLVGSNGLGKWTRREVSLLLARQSDEEIGGVVPVLISGASRRELRGFLRTHNWVDFSGGLTAGGVDGLAERLRRGAQALRAGPIPAEAHRESGNGDSLAAYLKWAREHYGSAQAKALGPAGVSMDLDQVYIPLRVARRSADGVDDQTATARSHSKLADERSGEAPAGEILAQGSRHVLLLGHPGSGKSTVLLQLLRGCFDRTTNPVGLAPGTVPLLLRLGHLTADDLHGSLGDFVERELAEASGHTLPEGLGKQLWSEHDLLVLLDGLDEIADDGIRDRFWELLAFELTAPERSGVRMVVSSRFAGLRGRSDTARSPEPVIEKFEAEVLLLEICPLDIEQCQRFVRRWFDAAQAVLPDYTASEARDAVTGLSDLLGRQRLGGQGGRALAGSPLLLTLLCAVVQRGGAVPRHRVDFYEESLGLLLGPRHRSGETAARTSSTPLLDVESALASLRPLAWTLHVSHRRDLSWAALASHLEGRLAALGRPRLGFAAAKWLHRETGVLAELAPGRFGFLDRGFQEFLAAVHVANEGKELLEKLCAQSGDEWWQEVLVLVVALRGRRLFVPVMERLLTAPDLAAREPLLRLCLDEATEVELGPFLAHLEPTGRPERLMVLLRLLRGRNDPRSLGRIAPLASHSDPGVAELAQEIAGNLTRSTMGESTVDAVLVVHHPDDRTAARVLVAGLREAAWRVLASGDRLSAEEMVENAGAVVLVAGPSGRPCWESEDIRAVLEILTGRQRPLFLVQLPGSGEVAMSPPDLPVQGRVDLREGLTGAVEALGRVMEGGLERKAAGGSEVTQLDTDGSWTEPETGIRFLRIPGGKFQMGGDLSPIEQPVHWVRVSPFWLAETPVTNRQYELFLSKHPEHKEPVLWKDPRFADPDQPIVGVTWHDAGKFCAWLSECTGRPMRIPTEAQWEFAARATDGRKYPWGNDPPDSTRACFGVDLAQGHPAPVGVHPAGRGPFGTLDQAGNVWEWCLDSWEENYDGWAGREPEPLDPITERPGEMQVVRGGCWYFSAEYLRASYRRRLRHWYRNDDVGIRPAASLRDGLQISSNRDDG